ncbi:ycf68 [Olea europaea subsp. europaea]|uniref:Ycf68 (Chloroplast) n=1 Tax=Olea europaea subsp. europaea TaxID=158383 RepID=A0A8S0RAF6_OLEEU|nr:ycf68 [Olea europaea subsp. europaea]
MVEQQLLLDSYNRTLLKGRHVYPYLSFYSSFSSPSRETLSFIQDLCPRGDGATEVLRIQETSFQVHLLYISDTQGRTRWGGLGKAAIKRISLIFPSRKEERETLFPFRRDQERRDEENRCGKESQTEPSTDQESYYLQRWATSSGAAACGRAS